MVDVVQLLAELEQVAVLCLMFHRTPSCYLV